MPSSRTSAGASTISGPTCRPMPASLTRSPNWPRSSDASPTEWVRHKLTSANATVPNTVLRHEVRLLRRQRRRLDLRRLDRAVLAAASRARRDPIPRFAPGPAVPLPSRDAVPPLSHRACGRAPAGQWAPRRRRPGPRDPGPPVSTEGAAAQGWPAKTQALGPDAARCDERLRSPDPMGLVHDHPADAPTLASRAGAEEVDLRAGPEARTTFDRFRDGRADPASRPREPAMGMHPHPGRAAKAGHPGGCHDD